MSFACRPNLSSGVVVNPIDVTSIGDTEINPVNPTATIQFQTGGTITPTGNGTTAGPNWFSPPTAGVGSSYWIRMTVTAGTNPNGGTVGAWLALSGAPSWNWNRSTNGTTSATVTLEIASDSGGTNIVASRTGITVSVVRDIA